MGLVISGNSDSESAVVSYDLLMRWEWEGGASGPATDSVERIEHPDAGQSLVEILPNAQELAGISVTRTVSAPGLG